MRANRLKEKIAAGVPAYGLFVSIPHPVAVEMIGHADYDFVIIDREHASTSMETTESLIRAAELTGMTPLVRVAGAERTEILKVLDCGAQGIVIPHVECREQVEEVVRCAFYHPIGRRSLNSGRPAAFAKHSLTAYIARANEALLIVPMIESAEGVARRASILSAPHVGFVLEGAADLSQSLGVPWDTGHPEVMRQLELLHEASQRCGVPYATVSRSADGHRLWAEKGVRIFVLGDDRNTAFRAYRGKRDDYVAATREAVASAANSGSKTEVTATTVDGASAPGGVKADGAGTTVEGAAERGGRADGIATTVDGASAPGGVKADGAGTTVQGAAERGGRADGIWLAAEAAARQAAEGPKPIAGKKGEGG
ncbi:HpcH/HpaI aldolase family protein [Cohnella rhizosphaerae]|uniref:Aldolase/citrate lyase family protein n=1 Tax=Cohnella rhizosphaerae TaxID=1457232 RepID=A0A9X4KX19_9BACL|nr:aldolase/citrate lyase family protein [Cohnella rhizosphaerae]MDG0809784.1 aldolase/citrate lyase family protein [Cohnella rhizosphaerae]